MYNFEKEILQLLTKHTSDELAYEEGKLLAELYSQQPWVKKLEIFNEQALFIHDNYRAKYLYVNPSIELICGYPASQFKDISFIGNLLKEDEMICLLQATEIGLRSAAQYAHTAEEVKRLRFTRNNFFHHKDGRKLNILQKSIPLATSQDGKILLEFNLITNISAFNDAPLHFYRLDRLSENGEEELLLEGCLEQRHITDREKEIFKKICEGKTSEKIAEELAISVETVKTHRRNLLQKTASENSVDLLRYGYAKGWI